MARSISFCSLASDSRTAEHGPMADGHQRRRFQHLGVIEAPSAQEARNKAINLYRITKAQLPKLMITKIGGRSAIGKS
jgi:hypothetical protein